MRALLATATAVNGILAGATADRFRPMDDAEIDALTGALASYGIVGQGINEIEVDYTRRIRLLAYVDASFYSNFIARSGPMGHTDFIAALVFTPDGKTVVTGSSDKSIKFWDVTALPR